MTAPDIWSLDVETKDLVTSGGPYALEPFRLKDGTACITDLSVAGPENYSKHVNLLESTNPSGEVASILHFLKGKIVYMHSAVFDTAWLYAQIDDIEPLKAIKIRDTMLLAKWILNGQTFDYGGDKSLTLIDLCIRFMPDHPLFCLLYTSDAADE